MVPPIFSSGGCNLVKLRLAPFAQLDTLELATFFKILETERKFSDFAPRISKVSLAHSRVLLLGWALRSGIVSHLRRARLRMTHEGSASYTSAIQEYPSERLSVAKHRSPLKRL